MFKTAAGIFKSFCKNGSMEYHIKHCMKEGYKGECLSDRAKEDAQKLRQKLKEDPRSLDK